MRNDINPNDRTQLPRDLTAECGLIGAIIQDSSWLYVAQERLRPDDFTSPHNRAIYEAMIEMAADGKLVKGELPDPNLICSIINSHGHADCFTAGEPGPYLMRAKEYFTDHPQNAEKYIELVKRAARRRAIIASAEQLADEAHAVGADRRLDELERSIPQRFQDFGGGLAGVAFAPTLASEIVPLDIEWLWPGYIPRHSIVMIDGDPGVGKSQIAIDLCARVSRGAAMPDGSMPGSSGRVMYISAEDDEARTIVPRFNAAHGDLSNVALVSSMIPDGKGGKRPLTIPDDVPLIESWICQLQITLIVFDVLDSFLAGRIDTYKSHDVRRALGAMTDLAQTTGVAILLLRHLTKDDSKKALYRGLGSVGITGAARVSFLVTNHPQDESRRLFACTKANLGKKPGTLAYQIVEREGDLTSHVEWFEGIVDISADDALCKPDGEADRAIQFLHDELDGGERLTNEIKDAAKLSGLAWVTVRKAAKGLVSHYRQDPRDKHSPWVMSLKQKMDHLRSSGSPGSFVTALSGGPDDQVISDDPFRRNGTGLPPDANPSRERLIEPDTSTDSAEIF